MPCGRWLQAGHVAGIPGHCSLSLRLYHRWQPANRTGNSCSSSAHGRSRKLYTVGTLFDDSRNAEDDTSRSLMIRNAHHIMRTAHQMMRTAHQMMRTDHRMIRNAHQIIRNAHQMMRHAHQIMRHAHQMM